MLIAQGLTNREIAERLVISEWTADSHVRHILTKLGVTVARAGRHLGHRAGAARGGPALRGRRRRPQARPGSAATLRRAVTSARRGRTVRRDHRVRRDRGGRPLRRLADGDAAGPQGLPRAAGGPGHLPQRHTLDPLHPPAPAWRGSKRWGLLDRVAALELPAVDPQTTLDLGPVRPQRLPAAGRRRRRRRTRPRRTVLDKILVDAAVAAGAELRERFTVSELLRDGDGVTGVRGGTVGGAPVDGGGPHRRRRRRPALAGRAERPSPAYHDQARAYLRLLHLLDRRPRRRGRVLPPPAAAMVAPPDQRRPRLHRRRVAERRRSTAVRADVEGHYLRALELAPGLAERVRAGRRVERYLGTADLPNFFRKPYGPGWALVGDAGYHKDPITGAGHHRRVPRRRAAGRGDRAGFCGPPAAGGSARGVRAAAQRGDAGRCTSSPASSPAWSRPRPRCSSSSPPCAGTRRRPTASSARSPARCPPPSSSRQRTSSGSWAPPGGVAAPPSAREGRGRPAHRANVVSGARPVSEQHSVGCTACGTICLLVRAAGSGHLDRSGDAGRCAGASRVAARSPRWPRRSASSRCCWCGQLRAPCGSVREPGRPAARLPDPDHLGWRAGRRWLSPRRPTWRLPRLAPPENASAWATEQGLLAADPC